MNTVVLKAIVVLLHFTVLLGKLKSTTTTAATKSSWVEEFCRECADFGDACVFHAPTQRCFAFERHQPMTWHHANDWCVNENFTGLARVHSKEADESIQRFLRRRNWHYGNSFAYWIGGSFEQHIENWRWIGEEGSEMDYHNWEVNLPGYKTQPDSPLTDSCVDLELRYVDGVTPLYGWYDTRCDHLQFFICELVSQ